MSEWVPGPPESRIVSTRWFAVSRDTLFGAFSDPARLARWWGPAGFTNHFEQFDFRPGGAWRLVMRAPENAEYRLEKRFLEIVPGRRIVLLNLQTGHRFRMEMEFVDENGGTRLRWTMDFEDPDEAVAVRTAVTVANEQNFDRLDAMLRSGGGTDPVGDRRGTTEAGGMT
jgi:uncharacterized protein YndB with AHSA1/START domain